MWKKPRTFKLKTVKQMTEIKFRKHSIESTMCDLTSPEHGTKTKKNTTVTEQTVCIVTIRV